MLEILKGDSCFSEMSSKGFGICCYLDFWEPDQWKSYNGCSELHQPLTIGQDAQVVV
jgi:hypothetical protein